MWRMCRFLKGNPFLRIVYQPELITMYIMFPSGNYVRFTYHGNELPFKIETLAIFSNTNPHSFGLQIQLLADVHSLYQAEADEPI